MWSLSIWTYGVEGAGQKGNGRGVKGAGKTGKEHESGSGCVSGHVVESECYNRVLYSSSIIISHHQSSSIIINHHQTSLSIIISNHHQSSSIIINRHQSSPSIIINHHWMCSACRFYTTIIN